MEDKPLPTKPKAITCPKCGGRGLQDKLIIYDGLGSRITVKCPQCHGRGFIPVILDSENV